MGFVDCLRRFSQIVLIAINVIVVVSLIQSFAYHCTHCIRSL